MITLYSRKKTPEDDKEKNETPYSRPKTGTKQRNQIKVPPIEGTRWGPKPRRRGWEVMETEETDSEEEESEESEEENTEYEEERRTNPRKYQKKEYGKTNIETKELIREVIQEMMPKLIAGITAVMLQIATAKEMNEEGRTHIIKEGVTDLIEEVFGTKESEPEDMEKSWAEEVDEAEKKTTQMAKKRKKIQN